MKKRISFEFRRKRKTWGPKMILRLQYVLDSDFSQFIISLLNLFDLNFLSELTWLLIQLILRQKKRDHRSGAVYIGVKRRLEACPYLVVKEKNNNLYFFNTMKSLASTLKKE